MLNYVNVKQLLRIALPLLVIIVGVLFVSLPMGPFQTLDTQLEYNTTQGVLRWGYPYLDRYGAPYNDSYGDLFNMPPMGFYTQALSLTIFGSSLQNGVALVTVFGLGCIVMVYLLGKKMYGDLAGVFAAALFALAPWELIMSRAYLIDAQCLLFSLIYLYVGILAIEKDSIKYAFASGVFFAAALLTKQFAVFMLLPLLLFYIYRKPKSPKAIIISKIAVFASPAVFSSFLWYQVIMGKELLYLFRHNDFKDYNFPEVVANYGFVPSFLANYGLGFLFCVAVIFSFAVGFLLWRRYPKSVIFSDIVCLATLGLIVGLELFMAVNLNLKAPYTSAIKYTYHALPFFSLAAASIATKSGLLLKSAQSTVKIKRILLLAVGIAGLVLLAASIAANVYADLQLSTVPYFVLRVQPGLDVGYSFFVDSPVTPGSPLQVVQVLGFLLVLLGLVWAGLAAFSARFRRDGVSPL
jgi:4-amino-4-deoxy-L-arabinose transferase-like glycosyltransferase